MVPVAYETNWSVGSACRLHGFFAALRMTKRFLRAMISGCASIDCMASITIRNLEESTKRKLKIRAATHGRSMERRRAKS